MTDDQETTEPSRILSSSVRRFLHKPRTARLATISPDGYPHVVPIWFMLFGDDILFGTDRNERKVWNILANPRAAVVIGGEPEEDEAGYMIQGDIVIEEDRGHALYRRMLLRYKAALPKDWASGDGVVLRLKPKKVIRVW